MKQVLKSIGAVPSNPYLKGKMLKQLNNNVVMVILKDRSTATLINGMVIASDLESLPVGYVGEHFDPSCWLPIIGDMTIHCEP